LSIYPVWGNVHGAEERRSKKKNHQMFRTLLRTLVL